MPELCNWKAAPGEADSTSPTRAGTGWPLAERNGGFGPCQEVLEDFLLHDGIV